MTDWTSIQIEYEQGKEPRELAKKYGLKPKQISDKAHNNKWKKPKDNNSEIIEESRKINEEKIKDLFGNSLNVLAEIIKDPVSKTTDKIAAIRCVIDISGYKKQQQDINATGINIEVASEKDKKTIEDL